MGPVSRRVLAGHRSVVRLAADAEVHSTGRQSAGAAPRGVLRGERVGRRAARSGSFRARGAGGRTDVGCVDVGENAGGSVGRTDGALRVEEMLSGDGEGDVGRGGERVEKRRRETER